MFELKTLLTEAKSSLQDLETLLRQAQSLDQSIPDPVFCREEIQSYFAEILKIVERIPGNLKLEQNLHRKDEIQRLHSEMETVRHRVEQSLGLVEAICERNVKQLSELVENLEQRFATIAEEGQLRPPISHLSELLRQGKVYLENKDYEACTKLMNEALNVAPNHSEAASCLEEAQRKWQDQRLEEELVIHIENLKKDAMDLFDQENYKDCVGMFKFLCELEPRNRTLRDYLELSQLKLQESEDAAMPRQEASPSTMSDLHAHAENNAIPPSQPKANCGGSDIGPPTDQLKTNSISIHEFQDASTVAAPRTIQPKLEESSRDDAADNGIEADRTVKSKRVSLIVSGFIALLAVVMAWTLSRQSKQPSLFGKLEIHSEPSGAKVFVDNEFRGETRLRLESLAEGQHVLRVEKQGYIPVSQAFTIEAQTPAAVSVQLQSLEAEPTPIKQLWQEASELFDRGQLLEASQLSDVILGRDPGNAMAASLKIKIQSTYWQQSQVARRRGKPEDAQLALENLLKVSPQHSGALRELKRLKPKVKKESDPALAEQLQLRNTIYGLHHRIAAAMGSRNYFPPASENAFELVQRLGEITPTDPVFKDTLDKLHRESISQLQRKIQNKDLESAKSLGRQFQSYFPASAELRNLCESLNADETRQLEARATLMQSLNSALARGNYVTPANENALAYCNRLLGLGLEPQNSKIQTLRRETLSKAATQASDLATQEKFEEARAILSALLTVAQNESRPAAAQELRSKLDKLEFSVYPVIHDHALGSCSGRLRMNAYVIAYVPSSDSKDGFSEKLSELGETEAGDKLKIQLKNKTYRFQANLIKNKEENRKKVEEIYRKLNELMKKEGRMMNHEG